MSACAAGYAEHVDADLALAFVDGTMRPAERAEVERRMDACSGCRGVVALAARDTEPGTKLDKPRSNNSGERNRSVQLVAGDKVGRYVVERALGAGGMGVVSLARDPELRRAVVIKLVRPDAWDDDLEARLQREAQAMAQLSHPNVVQIFDIGRHGDRVFLAMEFIAGQTLDAWLIERERSTDELIAMFLQAGAGLEAAHRAGLLHRDFKPTNVLVDRNSIAKVTDFGLARAIAAPAERAHAQPRMSGAHAVLTHVDTVIGTPAYMAPEQVAGEPLDARTDEYALALALLDALVGQQPSSRTVKPADPERVDAALASRVSPRVRAAIVRALSLQPNDRWPDLASFLRELAPERTERRWWTYAVAGAVAIAGVMVFVAMKAGDEGCVTQTPRTLASAREAIRNKLASDRVFAAWSTDYLLARAQAAADEIGIDEVKQCKGKQAETDCVKQRRAAFAAFIAGPSAVRFEACGTVPDEDRPRADELDRTGHTAMASGHFETAAEALVGELQAGERSGDDSIRGRAILNMLELARMRGDLLGARDAVRQLDGMLARHGNAPHDVFVVASAAADTLTELGEVDAAFVAIERAKGAAKTPAEIERAKNAELRARSILRLDDTAHPTPDPLARASLAELDQMPPGDFTQRARIDIARARRLYEAKDYERASKLLNDVLERTREPSSYVPDRERGGLSAYERVEARLLRCDVELELPKNSHCMDTEWLDKMHRQSPQRARYELQQVRGYELEGAKYWPTPLSRAIAILDAAKAKPLYVAELRLKWLRSGDQFNGDLKAEATRAREVFADAGRMAEVAELDAMIDNEDKRWGRVPIVPSDAAVDPWN